MNEDSDNTKSESNEHLEFNTNELEAIDISDDKLEEEDKNHTKAKKEAKKTAKKLLTPEERKKLQIKRGILAGIGVIVFLLMLLAVPATRWPILNAIGFRGNLVLTVNSSAQKPIAHASVKIEGSTVLTDQFGRAYFKRLPLGKKSVLIQKAGYGDKTVGVVNGFGSTENTYQLKVIGIKLDIDIKDWLSNRPLEGVTASFGEASAVSDQTGRAGLVILPTDKEKITITLKKDGYLEKVIETETDVVSREASLVSAQKNYFISKRDGKFDIFSSNLDGTNQQKIIEATGKEDASILQFSVHRGNKQAVLVANRDGKTQNGRLVAGVYAVDLERSAIHKIDEGSDIQLLEWGDSAIAYTKSIPSLAYDDPALSRVMVFRVDTNRLSEVVAANYFQTSIVAQNKVFYMPADAYRAIENAALTSHDMSTAAKKTYVPERPINYIVRVSYQMLELQDGSGGAFELNIAKGSVRPIDRRPAANSLMTALSPNGQLTTWNDRRDGQGTLIIRTNNGEERVAAKIPGLTSPVRFVTDDMVVARIVTSEETADYIVNVNTGNLKKIVDVSNVGGFGQPGL